MNWPGRELPCTMIPRIANRNRVIGLRIFHCIGRDVHADYFSGQLCKLGRSIARPATGIQHALALGITASERVSGHMFAPEVVVYLARNNPFSGEFNQRLAPHE